MKGMSERLTKTKAKALARSLGRMIARAPVLTPFCRGRSAQKTRGIYLLCLHKRTLNIALRQACEARGPEPNEPVDARPLEGQGHRCDPRLFRPSGG